MKNQGLLKPAEKQKRSDTMGWIKVTPETMPPDMEPVIVTLRFSDTDGKFVWADVRHNGEKWEYLSNCWDNTWSDVDGEVTHWMQYPEPAED